MKQIRHRSITPWVMVLLLTPLASPAIAIPYLVTYEADTPGVFPEDVEWDRYVNGGGAQRSVADGIFTLASTDPAVSDVYQFDGNEQMNPDPGEMFFAEWRMRVVPGSMDADISVFFASDDFGGDISMAWGENDFWSLFDFHHISLDATQFHSYRLVSVDMVTYDFFLDGEFAYQGRFDLPAGGSSFAFWGDGAVNSWSTSEWDYFRMGVIPEPTSVWLFVASILLAPRRVARTL